MSGKLTLRESTKASRLYKGSKKAHTYCDSPELALIGLLLFQGPNCERQRWHHTASALGYSELRWLKPAIYIPKLLDHLPGTHTVCTPSPELGP